MLNSTYFVQCGPPNIGNIGKYFFWRKLNFAGSGVRNVYFAGIPAIVGRLACLPTVETFVRTQKKFRQRGR